MTEKYPLPWKAGAAYFLQFFTLYALFSFAKLLMFSPILPELRIYCMPGIILNALYICVHTKSLQLCPTLCSSMDCSLPGSSVQGILQARILEWITMPSSRGSSRPRDEHASLASPALAGGFFTTSATWEAHFTYRLI